MSLTWAQFKIEVRIYLHLYNEVCNVQTLIDRIIPAGAADIQRGIEFYRTGHTNTFALADVTVDGFANRLTAPSGKIDSARLVKYDTVATALVPEVFRSLEQVPWTEFQAMRAGLVDASVGRMAINPATRVFAFTPGLNAETRLVLEWTGVKTDFADDDVTPFDARMAEAVAYFTLARVSRVTDKDMQQHATYEREYLNLKRKIFSDKNAEALAKDPVPSQLDVATEE